MLGGPVTWAAGYLDRKAGQFKRLMRAGKHAVFAQVASAHNAMRRCYRWTVKPWRLE